MLCSPLRALASLPVIVHLAVEKSAASQRHDSVCRSHWTDPPLARRRPYAAIQLRIPAVQLNVLPRSVSGFDAASQAAFGTAWRRSHQHQATPLCCQSPPNQDDPCSAICADTGGRTREPRCWPLRRVLTRLKASENVISCWDLPQQVPR